MRDTIDMAREAGAMFDLGDPHGDMLLVLKAFEALVRADEREACAKWLEDKADAPYLAERIRARGNT